VETGLKCCLAELGCRGLKGILTDGAVLFYLQPLECLSENDDFDDDDDNNNNNNHSPRVCHEGIWVMADVTSSLTIDTLLQGRSQGLRVNRPNIVGG
jgi:hypothetical protein